MLASGPETIASPPDLFSPGIFVLQKQNADLARVESTKCLLGRITVSKKLMNCLKLFLLFPPLVYVTDMNPDSQRP